ncbi:hypothetical protein HMPREF1553_00106 [Porphyromonas gingivalis F0568]|nr:hypothetical protein HMPREF1553_00106 [Porphyromonas gingivalis F0568]
MPKAKKKEEKSDLYVYIQIKKVKKPNQSTGFMKNQYLCRKHQ